MLADGERERHEGAGCRANADMSIRQVAYRLALRGRVAKLEADRGITASVHFQITGSEATRGRSQRSAPGQGTAEHEPRVSRFVHFSSHIRTRHQNSTTASKVPAVSGSKPSPICSSGTCNIADLSPDTIPASGTSRRLRLPKADFSIRAQAGTPGRRNAGHADLMLYAARVSSAAFRITQAGAVARVGCLVHRVRLRQAYLGP